MEKGDYRNYIRIRGASEHNLKNIAFELIASPGIIAINSICLTSYPHKYIY